MAFSSPVARKREMFSLLVLVAALFALSPVQVASQAGPAVAGTPAGAICQDPQLTTLCRIIKSAGNGEGATTLKSGRSLETVFAPTNEAFNQDQKSIASKLKLKDFNDIFTTPTAADRLLRGLIIPNQSIMSSGLRSGNNYKNLLGQTMSYSTAIFTSQVYISSPQQKGEIVGKDIRAGQGVIYKVNRVPYPSS